MGRSISLVSSLSSGIANVAIEGGDLLSLSGNGGGLS